MVEKENQRGYLASLDCGQSFEPFPIKCDSGQSVFWIALRGIDAKPSMSETACMPAALETKAVAGGLVVSNPNILGGTPVFRGTRLPVKSLFDYLADGLSLDYFLETFEGVTREQARAVLSYGWERIEHELKSR